MKTSLNCEISSAIQNCMLEAFGVLPIPTHYVHPSIEGMTILCFYYIPPCTYY